MLKRRKSRGWYCHFRGGRGRKSGGGGNRWRDRHTWCDFMKIYCYFCLFFWFFISLKMFLYCTNPSISCVSFSAHIIEGSMSLKKSKPSWIINAFARLSNGILFSGTTSVTSSSLSLAVVLKHSSPSSWFLLIPLGVVFVSCWFYPKIHILKPSFPTCVVIFTISSMISLTSSIVACTGIHNI